MQKHFIIGLVLISSLSVMAKMDDDSEKLQPCMQIKKACEGVGYNKGKIKVKDCMQKITNGELVDGVKVSVDVVNGCKEKHEK